MSEINHLKRAETNFSSAKILFDTGDYEGSVNRAYYAMHSAALHLFFIKDIPLPKTHNGTHTLLNQRFVQSGNITAERAADLSKVENIRLAADYRGDSVSQSDAEKCIAKAEEFLSVIKKFLAKD